MTDWSSLAPDLIRHVADLLLGISDVDGYMDMRAVCGGWRSAVAKPCSEGAADLRFCPRQLVMLDEDDDDDEGRLFVNVSTGRFFRRRLPLLRAAHALVGASDGLLVIADSLNSHAGLVLNPFTGHTIRFAAPILDFDGGMVAVAAGSDPMLLLATTGDMYGRPLAWFAEPDSQDFYCRLVGSTRHIAATVAYAGQIYTAYSDGSVFRRVGSAQHGHEEPIISAGGLPGDHQTELEGVFLVESAGELLLVLRQRCAFKVFRVDVERNALEPATTSIGGRALFLGPRCLSVAADKFPTIEGDCLYYATSLFDTQSHEVQRMDRFGLEEPGLEHICIPAFESIARVFHAYCLNLPVVRDQLNLPRLR